MTERKRHACCCAVLCGPAAAAAAAVLHAPCPASRTHPAGTAAPSACAGPAAQGAGSRVDEQRQGGGQRQSRGKGSRMGSKQGGRMQGWQAAADGTTGRPCPLPTSRSALVPSLKRLPPMASISSMKMMHGSCSRAYLQPKPGGRGQGPGSVVMASISGRQAVRTGVKGSKRCTILLQQPVPLAAPPHPIPP